MMKKWHRFLCDLYKLEKLSFKRYVKILDATRDPTLVMFSYSSSMAFGACVHVEWDLDSFLIVPQLLFAKNRIAPMRKPTIPRLEQCCAVLSSRLRIVLEEQ